VEWNFVVGDKLTRGIVLGILMPCSNSAEYSRKSRSDLHDVAQDGKKNKENFEVVVKKENCT
jgi:hypothetical protein